MVKLYPPRFTYRFLLFLATASYVGPSMGLAKGPVEINKTLRLASVLCSVESPAKPQPGGKDLAEQGFPLPFSELRQGMQNILPTADIQEIITTTWNGTSWSNGVPDGTTHVLISGAYSGGGFSCLDLTIGAAVVFAPSAEVHVGGKLTSNTTAISGSIVLDSPASAQTVKGTFNNLIISNTQGVSLDGSVAIKGTLKLQSGVLSTSNLPLVILSSASGTGRIAKIEDGASLNGNVTVQRFVPGSTKGWHMMAPAVGNQTQTSWTDNFTILNNSLFLHNEGGMMNVDDQINGWEYPPGIPNATLSLGRGYRTFLNQSFFSGTATFDNVGPIHQGDFTFNVSFSPGGYGGGGWNLIANPYPCEIDWHALSKTLVGGQIHFWNNGLYGSYSEGAGIGVNGGSRYIPSSQGFFVRATSAGPALGATEDAKPSTPQNNSFLRIAAADPEDVARFILKAENGDKDETAIRWMPQTTGDFDDLYDADKLPNENLAMYSLTNDGRKAAIQARPFVDNEEIYLGYGVKTEGNYKLQIHLGNEVVSGKTWYLKDNEYGTIYTLPQDYLMSFFVTGGVIESNWRFSILGVNNPVSVLKNKNVQVVVAPNPAQSKITIHNAGSIISYSILNMEGKVIAQGKNNGLDRFQFSTETLPKGIYQIQLHSISERVTERFIKD